MINTALIQNTIAAMKAAIGRLHPETSADIIEKSKTTIDQWQAILEAVQKPIPDGYMLVPCEPTLEMVMAGEEAFDEHLHIRCDFDRDKSIPPAPPWPSEERFELCCRVAYRAMLSKVGD